VSTFWREKIIYLRRQSKYDSPVISLIGYLLSGMSYADPMQQMIAVGLVSNGKYDVPAIHRMSWAEYVARIEEMRGVYRVLVGKPEGKRPVGRPRRRWEDNIKMDIQEVGWRDGLG
jgi:hypothetical protein